jgi:hypothetical protein
MLVSKFFFHLLYNTKIKKNINWASQFTLIYVSYFNHLIFAVYNQEKVYFYKKIHFNSLYSFTVKIPSTTIFNTVMLSVYNLLKSNDKVQLKYFIVKKSRFFYVLQVFIFILKNSFCELNFRNI